MRRKALILSVDGVVPLIRTYDIRVRNAIAMSRSPNPFSELDISRTTALQWTREGDKVVVTIPERDQSVEALIIENTTQKSVRLKR